ncbi:AurF N-oxygenase family protein [Williamsia serinedens]|uniref:p-aminobenzoate N-oxygenase AurF n=1 Tax=Williamsia serinedens TaxID=391736 RepID=A0ABT1GWN1_9NOCA|nr:diiron oxygenase [Williamsia serinedens]MCP2159360.1 P-aminobenzoate N-oxygenase AurF [Williamsia serinedens]
MTTLAGTDPAPSRVDAGMDEVAQRLVDSSLVASRNAMTEIDWTAPLDPDKHGCSPEWSALYGTAYWEELTDDQRVRLTRHEMASVMTICVWFEMMLQQLVIRDQRAVAAHSPEFTFAMTEIADECRHSLMFSAASQRIVGRSYHPSPKVARMGRVFMNVARGEVAYAGILVAEEILDVLQRGSLGDPRVLPLIQTVNEVHVLEESRHMRFAREQVREAMVGAGRFRRASSAVLVALGAEMIVINLVRPQAFTDAGLDRRRAVGEMLANEHRHAMLRGSCVHLMQFLDEVGLLTPAASRIYRRCHLL